MQGCSGLLPLLAAECPDGILLVGTWRSLPSMPGYSRCHEALRQGATEGRGVVAQPWADDLPAQADLWRSRSADGLLCVIIHGLLERPLLVGTCYLPPKGSSGCP